MLAQVIRGYIPLRQPRWCHARRLSSTQRFLQRRFFFIHAPRSVRSIPHPLLMLLIRPLNASHIHARRPQRTPVAHIPEVAAPHTHPRHLCTPVAHTRQSPTTHARRARELDASLVRHPATKPSVALPCYPTRSHSPLAERLNCQPPTSPPRVADLLARRRCQLDAPLPRHLRRKPDTALAIPRARLPPRLPATRPAASTGLTLLRHHPPVLPLFIFLLLFLLHIFVSCLKIFMFL
ncbi:hypothetical protein K438DRAFT_1882130 [Mycena galopus ATCC 62051]|nr:hypothetical protein K438DRAFT_1882130 [Mycena galopus ATCC 62051]